MRMTHASGRLQARIPERTAASVEAPSGLLQHNQPSGQRALIYIPETSVQPEPMPVVVMLHGAGGTARHSMDLVREHADQLGFILLAPTSQGSTWDLVGRRSFGADVSALDALLEEVFATYRPDPARVAIAGFSDGGSYALSLGLVNGNLFTHIVAFSPGFMAPPEINGRPAIFMSHGLEDPVLPIEACSRRIAAQLRQRGLEPTYLEFPDGHTVPSSIAFSAFETFTGEHEAATAQPSAD